MSVKVYSPFSHNVSVIFILILKDTLNPFVTEGTAYENGRLALSGFSRWEVTVEFG